jgi:hypothetical protein
MNNNTQGSVPVLTGFVGFGLMLFMLFSILLTEGNQIGYLFKYLLIAGFLLGLLAPRPMLIVWLVSCGYLDFLKRLMVISGRIYRDDLFNVLGVSPMTLAGITCGAFLGGLFGGLKMRPVHLVLLAISGCIILATAAMSIHNTGFSFGSLAPDVANAGLYSLLLFVIPMLFQTREEILRLLRLLTVAWIPVMFYGVYQLAYGYREFEIEYLHTGLSIEIHQLITQRIRPFSTLSAPTALGTVGAGISALALILAFKPESKNLWRPYTWGPAILFALIYLVGMTASTIRTVLMIPVIAMVAAFAFRTRGATRLFYGCIIAGFLVIVFNSAFVLNNLYSWNDMLAHSTVGKVLGADAMNIATYTERLVGFQNVLMNPDAYTLFGYGASRGEDVGDPLYNHDMISNALVRHGIVPLAIVTIFGCWVLVKLHSALLVLPQDDKKLAAGLLATSLAMFMGSILSGNVLATFPNNVLLWLLLGAVALLVFDAEKKPVEETALEDASPHPACLPVKRVPMRPSGRGVSSFKMR